MKKILSIILAITIISCNSSNNTNLSSPDGKINIDFRVDNGVASYSVKKNNSIIEYCFKQGEYIVITE